MANFCQFEFEVRGKQNACYAFLGSTSAEDYSIVHENYYCRLLYNVKGELENGEFLSI